MILVHGYCGVHVNVALRPFASEFLFGRAGSVASPPFRARKQRLVMTISSVTVDADNTILRSNDLEPVIRRLRSLLERVSSGQVVASPGFEQRLFGALVALEVVGSGDAINARTLVDRLA